MDWSVERAGKCRLDNSASIIRGLEAWDAENSVPTYINT